MLPFSEFFALAKRGETDIVLKNYGNSTLQDRIIATDFSQIIDFKIGNKEKLLYIVDQAHDVLSEFQIPEIKCPNHPGVVRCSDYFMEEDIVCDDQVRKFYSKKDR